MKAGGVKSRNSIDSKLQVERETNKGIKITLPCVWFYRWKLLPDLQITKMIKMELPCVVIIPTQDNKLTDQKGRWMKPCYTNALLHALIIHISVTTYTLSCTMYLVIVDLTKSYKSERSNRNQFSFCSVKLTPQCNICEKSIQFYQIFTLEFSGSENWKIREMLRFWRNIVLKGFPIGT